MREAAGQRVLCVCHGGVIRAFRVLLEQIEAARYHELLDWWCPNGHMRWYSLQQGIGKVKEVYMEVHTEELL